MQKKIIIGLALILGVGMTIFSYTMISQRVESAMETVQVVALKNDVEAFSTIDSKNITTIFVPPNIVDENTVTKKEEIIGQATAIPIYAGKLIDARNMVGTKDDTREKQVVGVYIDAARCAGVTEGDIVDIYRVTAAVGNPSPCIASNSRVLKITDEKGASVKNTSIAASVASEAGAVKTPRIVYLLVKPAEVSFVIQGSVDQEKSYLALAKKSKESEPVSVVGVVEE